MSLLRNTIIIAIAIPIAASQSTLAALALQNYQADKHHRFDNDPAFIGSGHDWSGVARDNNETAKPGGVRRWVTMISSTYFITSNHAAPNVNDSVTFHEDNNPTGNTVTRTVISKTRIGTTDLVIGRLNSTPGPTITHYSLFSTGTTQAAFASSPYSGLTAFVTGLNNTGSGTTQFRVGRNVLDGFFDNIEAPTGTFGNAITFNDDRHTVDSLGDDEAHLQGGDSGAPLFVSTGSDLVLTGINWFQGSISGQQLSGATFVSNYITEINAILATGGESLTLVATVPEPSTAVLFALGALPLLRRRR